MPSFSSALRTELARLLAPLANATGSADRWDRILALVGRNANGDTGLRTALDQLGGLAALGDGVEDGWGGVEAVLSASADAMSALDELEHAASNGSFANLGEDLAEQLTAIYLRRYHGLIFRSAAALTLVDPAESQDATDTSTAWNRDELHLERVKDLTEEPWGTLRSAYLPNDFKTAADAHAAADRLFPLLLAALNELQLPVTDERIPFLIPATGTPDQTGGDHFVDDEPAPEDIVVTPPGDLTAYYQATQPRLTLRVDDGTAADTFLGIVISASSLEHPGGLAGYVIALTGALNWTKTSGAWTITASTTGTLPAVVAGPTGIKPATGTATGGAKLVATRDGAFVIGSATGTRLELDKLAAALELTNSSAALALSTGNGKLVIAPGDGDGFLQSILPQDGISVDFTTGVSLSTNRGFELTGGVGLHANYPAHVELGPLGSIDSVELSLENGHAQITGGLTAHIGPIDVSIAGLGIAAEISDEPGNLGIADLDVGFKSPNQLGLSINAGPVSGGGLLAHDPDKGEYAGEVHLSFEGIGLRAVGLLTTTATGYSLLVLISADFPPVQLGMGFALVGVGGLLGLNRTVAVDALRAGLKTGALGAVLSPPDPKASAAQLVATLAGLFPPAQGRHIFAPTARIVWGTPTLLTIELGLVLELPSPVRLVALGRIKALLPSEDEAIVKLQVDVLGVIDFDRSEASVDATLVDSRIAQFAITGAMSFRLNWGSNPNFLLAIGGFHPRFQAPVGFPALERVSVPLANGDNPKLRLEAYLALTSNTVQFGARIDLAAKAGSFSIAGFLSFDALVTLSPLAFVVDIAAKLAVKAGGHTLLSISLSLTLSGPTPWRARGKASFSILFFDVSFSFDVTIGDAAQPALPAPVDVAPLILQALADPRSWSAQDAPSVVSLRQLDPGNAILAHPLATLGVRQRVAPLGRQLDRFGPKVPSGAKKFTITTATIGGIRSSLTPLQDRFAPAQFSALSDDDKLSAPSFEEMTSGAQLGADGFAAGTSVNVAVVYEQQLVPPIGIAEPKSTKLAMPDDVWSAFTATTPAPAPTYALR